MRWTARVPANCWIFIGCPPNSPNNSIKTTEFPGFSFFRGSSRHLDFGIAQIISVFPGNQLLDFYRLPSRFSQQTPSKPLEFPGFSILTCQTKSDAQVRKMHSISPCFYRYKWNVPTPLGFGVNPMRRGLGSYAPQPRVTPMMSPS